ncbi:MAG: type II toxin-antitoxin system toxin DNA ADP-ribosyl transferase DarT [Dermatophilaceae bacterium]
MLFHITRIERLPSVVEHGLLADSVCAARGVSGVALGNVEIKRRRAVRDVLCGSGGVVADYVPFYFAPRSPMLNTISRGNVSAEAADQEQIVYLVTSTQQLATHDIPFVTTDRNAALEHATFRDDDAALDSSSHVDWNVMRARIWRNDPEHYPDRRERRMAECLVHRHVPWEVFLGVAVRSAAAKAVADGTVATPGKSLRTYVRPGWYF